MIVLHFAGEKPFSDQLKYQGFDDTDVSNIIDALFAVSQIDSCVVGIPKEPEKPTEEHHTQPAETAAFSDAYKAVEEARHQTASKFAAGW